MSLKVSIGRSRLGVYPALLSYSRVFSIGRSRLGVYPALLSYSRVDGELWRRLDPRSGPTFATIHGHMIYGGWQDSRLVLSILTSISRGYELDSWAFPGLILYGGWLD